MKLSTVGAHNAFIMCGGIARLTLCPAQPFHSEIVGGTPPLLQSDATYKGHRYMGFS